MKQHKDKFLICDEIKGSDFIKKQKNIDLQKNAEKTFAVVAKKSKREKFRYLRDRAKWKAKTCPIKEKPIKEKNDGYWRLRTKKEFAKNIAPDAFLKVGAKLQKLVSAAESAKSQLPTIDDKIKIPNGKDLFQTCFPPGPESELPE